MSEQKKALTFSATKRICSHPRLALLSLLKKKTNNEKTNSPDIGPFPLSRGKLVSLRSNPT